MAVLIAHEANSSVFWPCWAIVSSNSNSQSVELSLPPVRQTVAVNTSFFATTQLVTVNLASYPIWTGTTQKEQTTGVQKHVGEVLPTLTSGAPGGAAHATGVQVPFKVVFESVAQVYPLLPPTVAP